MEKNNIINDWLDQHGDPEIDKKVEQELERMSREQHLVDMVKADEELGLYDEPKQEILEEAAKKYANKWYNSSDELSDFLISVASNSFKHGAKWQAERMYSEEDFKLFARQYYREIKLDKSNLLWDVLADKCFEQFKRK